ncbi:MAG TPA: ribbon-helix-helix protein, CopG family [Actinomycetota bacterium]|nr:ribbon-helix-helix protein, CopG family [Actinomycetota bacterium]
MRTTVTFDDDVAAAIERLRREGGRGLSEVVNELIRRGLAAEAEPPRRFRQRTAPLGLRIDVTDVAEALDLLEGPTHR